MVFTVLILLLVEYDYKMLLYLVILERNAAILEYANMYNYGSFILGLRHERLRQKRVLYLQSGRF